MQKDKNLILRRKDMTCKCSSEKSAKSKVQSSEPAAKKEASKPSNKKA